MEVGRQGSSLLSSNLWLPARPRSPSPLDRDLARTRPSAPPHILTSSPMSESSSSRTPSRRSLFRPCIDLHQGVVKQIVGGTLEHRADDAAAGADDDGGLKTNFVSECVLSELCARIVPWREVGCEHSNQGRWVPTGSSFRLCWHSPCCLHLLTAPALLARARPTPGSRRRTMRASTASTSSWVAMSSSSVPTTIRRRRRRSLPGPVRPPSPAQHRERWATKHADRVFDVFDL
jgi:hypothetical protein